MALNNTDYIIDLLKIVQGTRPDLYPNLRGLHDKAMIDLQLFSDQAEKEIADYRAEQELAKVKQQEDWVEKAKKQPHGLTPLPTERRL